MDTLKAVELCLIIAFTLGVLVGIYSGRSTSYKNTIIAEYLKNERRKDN